MSRAAGNEPPEPLRVAVIGAGFMGVTHARAIRAAGAVVEIVVVRQSDQLEAARHRVGARRSTLDLDAVLNRPDLDVVHICTPNASHAAIAFAAIAAGKHVVCEKPLTTDGASATALAAAATSRALIGAVPFVYRFHPMVREMRTRIGAGELGYPSVVHGSYLQDWLADPEAGNWRIDPEAAGPSRAFADIGSHWFDLLEFVTGDRVQAVSGQLKTVFGSRNGDPIRTEDAASVQFRTEAGVLGSMVVSQTAAGRKNRLHLEVSGNESSLAFDQEDPERLWAGRTDETRLLQRDPGRLGAEAARYAFLPAGHPQGLQDCFNALVGDVYQAIAGETPSGLPTFADGARAAQLCEAVLTSAATDSSWVETDFPEGHR